MSGCPHSPHPAPCFPHLPWLHTRPTVLSPASNAPPALCSTDEISSPLLQNPCQTESADTHDHIIPLASQIHSSPCGQENEPIEGFPLAPGGRAMVHFPRQKMCTSFSAMHFPYGAGQGKSALPFSGPGSVTHSLRAPYPCSTHSDNQAR